MLIDISQKDLNLSQLILETSSPRPIAWIVTEDSGVINIAPYSLFTPLSFAPPSVIVSIRSKENKEQKDTLINLRNTKRCTICMVEESYMDKLHATAKELPKEQSEAMAFDIDTKEIVEGYPPIVKGVSVAYFCELSKEIELENDTTVPVILNIKEIYLDDRCVTNQEELSLNFSPLAHIVGERYSTIEERII